MLEFMTNCIEFSEHPDIFEIQYNKTGIEPKEVEVCVAKGEEAGVS